MHFVTLRCNSSAFVDEWLRNLGSECTQWRNGPNINLSAAKYRRYLFHFMRTSFANVAELLSDVFRQNIQDSSQESEGQPIFRKAQTAKQQL